MKITGLKIENYMKIALLEITPKGVVTVKGKNGAGKSTVLDAIYYVITGGRSVEQPIREGEKKATIELTLEGKDRKLEITRTITKKSNSLKVVDNGVQKPQAIKILKELLNKVSIDPQKFLELKKEEQVELLTKVCVIDFDFEKELANHKENVEERKEIKRNSTYVESKLNGLDIPADVPDDIPNIEDISRQLQDALKHNADVEKKQKYIKELKEEGNAIAKRHKEIKQELLQMDEVESLIDIDEIQDKMKFANIAGKIQQKKEYEEELKDIKFNLNHIENNIKERKERKEKALSTADIPIQGLTTDGEGLILNEIPFEQASTAERIKTATTLAVLANKDLKLINIKEATLLDQHSLQAVKDVAAEHDCQLFMEVVSEDEDVVIEFSDVVEAEIESKPIIEEPEPTEEDEYTDEEPEPELEPKIDDMFEGLEDL